MLFGMFPTFVYILVNAVVNSALENPGVTEGFEIEEVPQTCW